MKTCTMLATVVKKALQAVGAWKYSGTAITEYTSAATVGSDHVRSGSSLFSHKAMLVMSRVNHCIMLAWSSDQKSASLNVPGFGTE